jgi:predicted naringenin-chalcone synthase
MQDVRGFTLWGLGTALPSHPMTQTEAADLAHQVCCPDDEQARLMRVVYRRSGVQNRYTVLPHRVALAYCDPKTEVGETGAAEVGEGGAKCSNGRASGPSTADRMEFYRQHAPALAEEAARKALTSCDLPAAAITHLVTVSCTGFAAPGVEFDLIDALGLNRTVQRTNVGFMGCHGALNGLRVARAMALAEADAKVLLCAVELCSIHYRFQWDPERFVGNVLFADGAAAAVGGAAPAGDAWRVVACGSCQFPDSQAAMSWQIGDYGFEMFLSPRVPDLICSHLRGWLESWLATQGLRLSDIASWAVHPGGPRILGAVEEALALPREATSVSREVLGECGNMSSPTVLFILERLRERNAPRPCVALGFGPGLVAEATLLV